MILVRYDRSKMLRRAAAFGVVGLMAFGSLVMAIVGVFLVGFVIAIVLKAMQGNSPAITRTDTGFTVTSLWSTKHIAFDDYRDLTLEVINYRILLFPVPIATNVVFHSKGLVWNKKIRLPVGFLELDKDDVPALKAALEASIASGNRQIAPPKPHGRPVRMAEAAAAAEARAIPVAAKAYAMVEPRGSFGRRARDPLEGAPRRDLM